MPTVKHIVPGGEEPTMVLFPKGFVALVLSSSACIWLIHAKVPLFLVFIPFPGSATALVKREPEEDPKLLSPVDDDRGV
jgi:hypothetical protein